MAVRTSLRREAGLLQVVMYGVGNIIGAGIYVLIGGAAGLAGSEIWLAFLIGAVVALFTGLSYAELASMYPKAASEYIYLGRAYGSRILSFSTEWIMLITEIVAAATVSLGFAEYFQNVLVFSPLLIAAGLLIVLTIVAILGIKDSLRINTILSFVAIAGLFIVIIAGIPRLGSVDYAYSPNGMDGVVAASILVFFAYIGFDNMSNLSEETKRPERTIPRGLLIAVFVTTAVYLLVGLAAVSLVPWQDLAASSAPLALAASIAFGPVAYAVLTVAALLTTFNTALVLLITGSRIVYGMAKERALPRALGKVSRKTGAPYAASIAILFIALAALSLGNIDIIAKVTSFGSLLTFALVNLALLRLRRAAPHVKRPFRTPLSLGWVSIPALLGLVSCLALLTQFGWVSAALGMLLPISGLAVYLLMKHAGLSSIDRRLLEREIKE
ncbi:Amino acid permease [uncultured archaeon]|nr:Amino acid permease [uncultured archaeon]